MLWVQIDGWHLRTDAVLIVNVVNLVDAKPLPVVQLLLLQEKLRHF